jgi:4-amino-4-deoxy-L-arabinose transferase-like glycosyltransferase
MERLGKTRHGREDRRLSEREVSESNLWLLTIRDVSTSLDMTNTVLEERRTLWIILAVGFVLFLIGNLPWQLDDYDQAKQAFTSFQMVKEGRWFYQQTPLEHVATKPPLVGWVSAGLFGLTRSWELSWRLPSLLAAIALAIFLFRAASSAYGPIAGLIALGAFELNLLSPRLATLVRTDMPLALVIFLIGLLIWHKLRAKTEWKLPDQLYLFALLTIAMLIKGPIVFAFVLPGVALFQWGRVGALRRLPKAFGTARDSVAVALRATRAPRTARRLQGAWPGWWPWVASLAVFLLWVAGGTLFQPGFFNEVVMREFVARFGETTHRPQPFYFYLPHLLHKFAPWSVLIIAVALVDLHSRKWRLRSALRKMSPEIFWLLCWSIGGLIVMSLIPSKRVDRIFPMVPPLCLLLAAQIGARISCSHGSVSRLPTTSQPDPTGHPPWQSFGVASRPVATGKAGRAYRWSAIALAFAILFTGGYTIFKVISGYTSHRDALAIFGRAVRREATAHHWRYEVVSTKDEGLLLYLQKMHFIEPNRVVAEWNNGNLDGLVASTEKAPALMRALRNAALSQLKSSERKGEQGSEYVLITR